jgi:hypothetical protein
MRMTNRPAVPVGRLSGGGRYGGKILGNNTTSPRGALGFRDGLEFIKTLFRIGRQRPLHVFESFLFRDYLLDCG